MKLSKEDLTKQIKSIYYFEPIEPIEIEWKKDSKIHIFEVPEALDFYKNYQSVFLLKEHIFSWEPEPLTTWLLFWWGMDKININDIRIVNYLNKWLVLIFVGIDSIWGFVLDRMLYPFNIQIHFDLLLNLYNQEKSNIFINKSWEIIHQCKVFNNLYLNDELWNILTSIDKDKFVNEIDYIEWEFFNKYSSEDIKDKLWNKKYIYLD